MTNEQLFIEYIRESAKSVANPHVEALNPEWVIEMLETLDSANREKRKLNPEWVNASHAIWYVGQQKQPEPMWLVYTCGKCEAIAKVHLPTEMDIAVGNLIDQEIAAGRLDPDWVEKRREEIRNKGI